MFCKKMKLLLVLQSRIIRGAPAAWKEESDMAASNKNKHLTLQERQIIETGIRNGSTQKAIADTLGKQKSTIGKEIKLHREIAYKCRLPVECALYQTCRPKGNCIGASCPKFVPFHCPRRDRSPGACNGCEKQTHCHFTKYKYSANKAQRAYEETLKHSRAGADLTTSEAAFIADTISPLLKQGQSLYTIRQNHPELGVCERTLYNYIENGVLHYTSNGVIPLDLRRQVSRRKRTPKNSLLKKREDRSWLIGRTYEDFLAYCKQNPDLPVVQMDTVYNARKDAESGSYTPAPPVLQTFKFPDLGFLFALFHTEFSSDEMLRGIDLLEHLLSPVLFRKHVPILLTDRGGEFVGCVEDMEHKEGNLRTRVFFCDPQAANQKGSLENNHIELRYILPKGTDLFELGLTDQDKLNLVLSHINSTSKEHLHGKTPLDLMEFLEPDLFRKFQDFGIHKIQGDKVILKPYLLK